MNVRLFFLILLLNPSMALSEIGFRDLTIGSKSSVIDEYCSNKGEFFNCYNIDDIKFSFDVTDPTVFKDFGTGTGSVKVGDDIDKVLNNCKNIRPSVYSCDDENVVTILTKQKKVWFIKIEITGEVTDIIQRVSVDIGPLYQSLLDNVIGDPKNPYLKLKKSLESKYQVDWEFTDRDRKLFNENERDSLWTSYNGGQIFSQILRKDKYSDLRLLVHYHTKEDGEKLSEVRKPQNVNFDDF